MSARSGSISVVVPVYNSERTLPLLRDRLAEVLESAVDGYELILVNDGSGDGSWEVIERLVGEHSWVRGINLARNYGQHNALLCGVRAAMCDVIVTMDDDLQHPPEEIPLLLAELDEGYDVVYGTTQTHPYGFLRRVASSATKLLVQRAMGARTAREVSSFRAFRRDVRNAFAQYESPLVLIDALLTWGADSFSSVVVRHEPRQIGESNYSLSRLLTHTLNLVTGFSIVPLQVASWVGMLFSIFGGVVFVYVLVNFLVRGGGVPGFSFIASTVALFSGIQLFALGLFGEYLARMHFQIMRKPTYVIKREVQSGRGERPNVG